MYDNTYVESPNSSWTIGQAKEHNQSFVQALISLECHFPFVSFFHPNIIEAPAHIKFGEILHSLQLINKF